MKLNRILPASVMLILLQPYAVAADEPIPVSIVGVIADPKHYSNKRIRLSGYVRIAFEQQELCLATEPPSKKECLWIEIDRGPYADEKDQSRYDRLFERWLRWEGKAVTVEADFSADDPVYRQYTGVLRNVLPPAEPRAARATQE